MTAVEVALFVAILFLTFVIPHCVSVLWYFRSPLSRRVRGADVSGAAGGLRTLFGLFMGRDVRGYRTTETSQVDNLMRVGEYLADDGFSYSRLKKLWIRSRRTREDQLFLEALVDINYWCYRRREHWLRPGVEDEWRFNGSSTGEGAPDSEQGRALVPECLELDRDAALREFGRMINRYEGALSCWKSLQQGAVVESPVQLCADSVYQAHMRSRFGPFNSPNSVRPHILLSTFVSNVRMAECARIFFFRIHSRPIGVGAILFILVVLKFLAHELNGYLMWNESTGAGARVEGFRALEGFGASHPWPMVFILFIAFSITTYMSFRDYPPSFYGFNRMKHAYLSQEVIAFSFTVESVLLTVAALSPDDGGNPLMKAMCFLLYVVNGLICISVRWRIKEVLDSAPAKREDR